MSEQRGNRKTRVGVVVSDKMDKTIVVAIRERVQHSLYGRMNRTVKFKAHDENNECGIGDKVRVMETRPLSKDKHWRMVEIIEKAEYYPYAINGPILEAQGHPRAGQGIAYFVRCQA